MPSSPKVLSLPTNKTSAGTVLDGRFEILSTLGNGAMSVVVAARHLQLRQKVAIKMLRPEYAGYQDVVTRFLREARAAACLRNEHVVSVTDVGMLPTGVPYLIMEHLHGTDLAAHLAAHGPLHVDQAVEYVFQVLEALAEAHRAGIIHRDIKPANLLLAEREDGSALIKVLDFGVSKFTGPDYTAHGLTVHAPLLGSPAYMSPEQIRDPSGVDARTDIWSVGVVLYELVTGHLPFEGRTAPELVSAICAPQPTPISPLISRAPIELVGVIGRCLHKSREGRFANVQDLARALVPFVRTAASQVSVDRVLGIASAPRPVAADVIERSSTSLTSANETKDGGLRTTRMTRPRSNLTLAAAGVVGACALGWGLAMAFGGGSSVALVTPPGQQPGVPGALCAAPEAESAPGLCPSPALEGTPLSEQSHTRTVTTPAVGGVTHSSSGNGRRLPNPQRPKEADEPETPAPAPEIAEDPTPRSVYGPNRTRPLDPQNPYSER